MVAFRTKLRSSPHDYASSNCHDKCHPTVMTSACGYSMANEAKPLGHHHFGFAVRKMMDLYRKMIDFCRTMTDLLSKNDGILLKNDGILHGTACAGQMWTHSRTPRWRQVVVTLTRMRQFDIKMKILQWKMKILH